MLGVSHDLMPIRRLVEGWEADVVFNLLDGVPGRRRLSGPRGELPGAAARSLYTGCNSLGIQLSRDKALSKKILLHHRIPTARFAVFPRGRAVRGHFGAALSPDREVRRRRGLSRHLPGLRRVGCREAARAGGLHPRECRQRRHRRGVHRGPRADRERARQRSTDDAAALGAQLQVVAGGQPAHRHRACQVRSRVPEARRPHDGPRPTESVAGARQAHRPCGPARLPRARPLGLRAARSARHAAQDEVSVIEANATPDIASDEDFADSARQAGIQYPQLLQRILNLALAYQPRWKTG